MKTAFLVVLTSFLTLSIFAEDVWYNWKGEPLNGGSAGNNNTSSTVAAPPVVPQQAEIAQDSITPGLRSRARLPYAHPYRYGYGSVYAYSGYYAPYYSAPYYAPAPYYNTPSPNSGFFLNYSNSGTNQGWSGGYRRPGFSFLWSE